MPSRYVILTGAPLIEQLNWSEEVFLTSPATAEQLSSAIEPSKWRAVPFHDTIGGQAQSLSTQVPGEHEDVTEASIVFYEDCEISQLTPVKLNSFDDSFGDAEADTSFLSSKSRLSNSQDHPQADEVYDVLKKGRMTDLKALPNATALQQLAPQPVTVDVLVAVVAVRPTKTVQLRRSSGQMEIAEVIVGDTTRAGFSINIWLAPASVNSHSTDDLRRLVRTLRAGDILAIHSLALSAFQGAVYGQTLNRRISKNATRIVKVHSHLNQSQKLQGLRDWAARFVSPSEQRDTLQTAKKRALPPDSQSQ